MADDEHRDELPDELDVSAFVGPYQFPDNSRRRIPGYLYLGVAVAVLRCCGSATTTAACSSTAASCRRRSSSRSSASYCITVRLAHAASTRRTRSSRRHKAVGFPVGHASAQLGWRGLRSRPTWRILLYSAEEPPKRRGFVLVDAVDGHIVDHFVEDNPEDWTEAATTQP